jgi:hypothetical protein
VETAGPDDARVRYKQQRDLMSDTRGWGVRGQQGPDTGDLQSEIKSIRQELLTSTISPERRRYQEQRLQAYEAKFDQSMDMGGLGEAIHNQAAYESFETSTAGEAAGYHIGRIRDILPQAGLKWDPKAMEWWIGGMRQQGWGDQAIAQELADLDGEARGGNYERLRGIFGQ